MANKSHRAYDNDLPSVTQVLDVLRKKGLEFWFKKNTIEFINNASNKGKLIGTQIHRCIQDYIEGKEVKIETEYPTEVMNALNSFMKFRKEHPEIDLKNSEIQMTSIKYGCNGTLDCEGTKKILAGLYQPNEFFKVDDNIPIIFDWKTGEAKDKNKPDIYPEYVYQLSAYVKFYNELFNTNIRDGLIVSVAKDKIAYNLREVNGQEIDEAFEEVFLSCLKILNYQNSKGGMRWKQQ